MNVHFGRTANGYHLIRRSRLKSSMVTTWWFALLIVLNQLIVPLMKQLLCFSPVCSRFSVRLKLLRLRISEYANAQKRDLLCKDLARHLILVLVLIMTVSDKRVCKLLRDRLLMTLMLAFSSTPGSLAVLGLRVAPHQDRSGSVMITMNGLLKYTKYGVIDLTHIGPFASSWLTRLSSPQNMEAIFSSSNMNTHMKEEHCSAISGMEITQDYCSEKRICFRRGSSLTISWLMWDCVMIAGLSSIYVLALLDLNPSLSIYLFFLVLVPILKSTRLNGHNLMSPSCCRIPSSRCVLMELTSKQMQNLLKGLLFAQRPWLVLRLQRQCRYLRNQPWRKTCIHYGILRRLAGKEKTDRRLCSLSWLIIEMGTHAVNKDEMSTCLKILRLGMTRLGRLGETFLKKANTLRSILSSHNLLYFDLGMLLVFYWCKHPVRKRHRWLLLSLRVARRVCFGMLRLRCRARYCLKMSLLPLMLLADVWALVLHTPAQRGMIDSLCSWVSHFLDAMAQDLFYRFVLQLRQYRLRRRSLQQK